MNLARTVEGLLTDAKYYVVNERGQKEWLFFEDANIFGFVSIKNTVADIITLWATEQGEFVAKYRTRMSLVPEKAWNAYAVFLTEDDCPPDARADLLAIEEDFRSARKIARAGLKSRVSVEAALAPILPLRFSGLHAEGQDQLAARIESDANIADPVKRLLREGATSDALVAALLEEL